jgi:transposase
MRQSKEPTYFRLELVRYAREHGVKPAARAFGTTPKTVRKWLGRWQPGSLRGLQDRSRAPKAPARRLPEEACERALELKRRLPSWGAARIKRDFDLPLSDKAIRRCWRDAGLLKRKRRKHRTKQDLRAIKAAWRLCEQMDIDTKDLIDIPELWPQIRQYRLPKVQYTAREVVSGLQFLAYAEERSLAYATLFAEILLAHLQRCGVDLTGCRIQTDNGSEFIGAWNAREDSAFTRTVEAIPGLTHTTIPPAAHTWQADVETVHGLIEDEFYEVERFTARQDFLAKAATYTLWCNIARTNSYKRHNTPWGIIHDRDPTISPQIATLPPVFLDELFVYRLDAKGKGGYDVLPHPYFRPDREGTDGRR